MPTATFAAVVSDVPQRFAYPTLEEWDNMLLHNPEGAARALYVLVLRWREIEPRNSQLIKLMQHAETVLAERFPDLKRPS
jgi:hypothetical protein